MQIYIAGAHSRARTLRTYIEFLYPDVKVVAFLVDDMSENPKYADGVPVMLIGDVIDNQYPVYIGTRSVNHKKLTDELQSVGFCNIIPLTVELDRKLRNQYVRKYYEKQGREFCMLKDLATGSSVQNEKTFIPVAGIYVASSAFDQPLQMKYDFIESEKVIQVGAALTEKRIAVDVITDCEGDNISKRNKQYCELTGLYWIWKHAVEDYIGLVHYRRHFLLPDDWLARMVKNNIDVVLPVPLYVSPSIADNYKERHIASDWDFLMDYLKSNLPQDYIASRDIFSGNLYSPCNMLIARREVINQLCEWLFPIVDAVAEHGGMKDSPYMNRYPGFVSERLITYFFETHRDKYKVAYADKNFLQ